MRLSSAVHGSGTNGRASATRRVVAAVAALAAMSALAPRAALADGEVVALKAQRVLTGTGEVIEHGVVLVRDGKIAAVGAGIDTPEGAQVIDLRDAVLTPGLIDAMCLVDSGVPDNPGRPRFREPVAPASDGLTRAPEQSSRAQVVSGAAAPGHVHGAGAPADAGQGFWARAAAEHERHDPNHFACCVAPPAAELAEDTRLSMALGLRDTWAEHSSEVVPHTNVVDSVNLLSRDFERLARGGVTTVYVSPDSASVIGGRGAIVKTGGPLSQRVVEPEAAVKATMGGDPSRRGRSNVMPYGTPTFHTRRPTTRMGVEWVFRKAFYDAMRAAQGLELVGADQPPAEALPVLRELLAGKAPLRIQARKQHDIFTAVRLAREFGLSFLLEEATEAYQCVELLKAAGLSVVYGPLYMDASGFRRLQGEGDDPRLTTPKLLHEAGIRFALTAQEMRDEEGLVRQAMVAAANGLPAQAALAAVTCWPAELLGLERRLGTLAVGQDADLVAWSAGPLRADSRAVLVMINGQVVVDER